MCLQQAQSAPYKVCLHDKYKYMHVFIMFLHLRAGRRATPVLQQRIGPGSLFQTSQASLVSNQVIDHRDR